MTWTFYDCEADASEMRGLAGVTEHARLSAREIGEAAGVKFTRRVLSGCAGELDLTELRVYANSRGRPWTRNFDDAHELQHLVRFLNLDPYPHDEDRVDWAAIALIMPRVQVREALHHASFDTPAKLIEMFPVVPPVMVLLRVAWVLGRPVAVHRSGHRSVWAPEDQDVPELSATESSLVRETRYTLTITRTLSGKVGIPIGDTGAKGILVIFPERASGDW